MLTSPLSKVRENGVQKSALEWHMNSSAFSWYHKCTHDHDVIRPWAILPSKTLSASSEMTCKDTDELINK